MDAHYIFPMFVSVYENYRAEALSKHLGISAPAVKLLDLVDCLPGISLGTAERALGCGRTQTVGAAFELQQLQFVQLHGSPDLTDEVCVFAACPPPALAEARRRVVEQFQASGDDGDVMRFIERYQEVVLANLCEPDADERQLAGAQLMRLLAGGRRALAAHAADAEPCPH